MINPPENYRLLVKGEIIEEKDLIYHKSYGKWLELKDYEGNPRIGYRFEYEIYWPRARRIKEIEIIEAQKLSILKFLRKNKAKNADCSMKITRNREIYKELARKNLIGVINWGNGDRYFLLDNRAGKQ